MRTLITSIFMLAAIAVCSQSVFPLDNMKWVIENNYWNYTLWPYEHDVVVTDYATANDTVIGNYTYTKIIKGDGSLYAFVRVDGEKVYATAKGIPDTLFLDFSLQKGDVLSGIYGGVDNSLGGFSRWVDSVDYVQLADGQLHKRLHIVNTNPESFYTSWIEGIGDVRGLFQFQSAYQSSYEGSYDEFLNDYTLTCEFQGDNEIFSQPSPSGEYDCDTKVPPIQVMPTSGSWKVEYDVPRDNISGVTTYQILGDTFLNGYNYTVLTNGVMYRVDSEKVYLKGVGGGDDILFMDFGLHTDDTLTNFPGAYNEANHQHTYILGEDSVIVGGTWHRRLHIQSNFIQCCDWIEGIGNTRGFYEWYFDQVNEESATLCFTQNNDVEWWQGSPSGKYTCDQTVTSADTVFPLHNCKWVIEQNSYQTNPYSHQYSVNDYSPGADTIVSGATWTKVTDQNGVFALVRVSGLKVHAYNLLDDNHSNLPDEIVEDFSLNVGDTLWNVYGGVDQNKNIYCWVDTVNYVTLADGRQHKRIHIATNAFPYREPTAWIEGVGDTHGLFDWIWSTSNATNSYNYTLTCFYQDGQKIYSVPSPSGEYDCDQIINGIAPVEKSNLIAYSQYGKIIVKSNQSGMVVIYNLNGQVVYHSFVAANSSYSSQVLPQGLYLVRLNSQTAKVIVQ